MNSSLVVYTQLSPNNSGKRTHVIDTVSIHCMAGNLTVERCGELFATYNATSGASSNYGIGSDGRIALYVDEANRSWCTSSSSNDNRSVTIEVANTSDREPYPISDEAYDSLIALLTDICQRNGIKQLVWSTNKSDRVNHLNGCNMTVHRDYKNKSCPGTYLYNLHQQIADDVNDRLEDNMTQEQFNTFMENYLSQRNNKEASDWAKAELAEGVEKGITDGTSPQGFATREQVTAMILRSMEVK